MRIHISNFYQRKRHELTKVSLTILTVLLLAALTCFALPSIQSNTLRFTGFNPIELNLSLFKVTVQADCSTQMLPQLQALCTNLVQQSGQSLNSFTNFLCQEKSSVVNNLAATLTNDADWLKIQTTHKTRGEAHEATTEASGDEGEKKQLLGVELSSLRSSANHLFKEATGNTKPSASAIREIDHGCSTFKRITFGTFMLISGLIAGSLTLVSAMLCVWSFAKNPNERTRTAIIATNIGASVLIAAGVSLYCSLGDYITRDRLDIFYTHTDGYHAVKSDPLTYSSGFYIITVLAIITFIVGIIVSRLLGPVFYANVQHQLVHYARNYDHAVVAPTLGGLVNEEFDGYIETQGSVLSDSDLLRSNVEVDDEIAANELRKLL